MPPKTFFMAGGGTGGHVVPAVAVARELKTRGHNPVFIGTHSGFESRLVPSAGFPLEFIEIGGLQRVGLARKLRTMGQLPLSFGACLRFFRKYGPAAVFSMGGYAAGPVTLAAWWRGVPIVVMEPNAIPGLANRQIGRFVKRALLAFEQTRRFFPPGRSEITGLPVRPEFAQIPAKRPGDVLTILITGGSRGSRTLNTATRACWPMLRDAPFKTYLIHQTGEEAYAGIARDFESSGVAGEIAPFIPDMPAAFARADLVVCRSGAGAVSELAAAGKPSILVPFPFASDDHQLRNAEAFAHAGAARLVLDSQLTGERLFSEIAGFAAAPAALEEMSRSVRAFAKPEAAKRAADVLEEVAR